MSTRRYVLGIDTSTVVNVGIACDGEVLASGRVDDRLAHVEQLTPLIRSCVAEAGVELADLDTVVVGLGPGPFTGLRVGIVSAQVLAAALGRPWRGVCSLDACAVEYAAGGYAGGEPGDFLVASDARRRELYWARYAANGVRVGEPQVSSPDAVPDLPVVGPAADLYADRLRAVPGPRTIDGGVLARVGLTLPDAGREPLYLRRPDATPSVRHKSVLHFGGSR